MTNIVFTNHVKDRLYERKISENQIYETINNSGEEKKMGDKFEFKKKFGKQTLTAVTKLGDKNEYVVLSAWIDPPNPGTRDEKKRSRYFESKKSGILKKFWLTLLNQIGI